MPLLVIFRQKIIYFSCVRNIGNHGRSGAFICLREAQMPLMVLAEILLPSDWSIGAGYCTWLQWIDWNVNLKVQIWICLPSLVLQIWKVLDMLVKAPGRGYWTFLDTKNFWFDLWLENWHALIYSMFEDWTLCSILKTYPWTINFGISVL